MKGLTEHHVADGFDEQHYALVTGNKKLINTLVQQILETHFTESTQEEIANGLGSDLQQTRKRRDPLFCKNILRVCKYQYTICGLNMRHDDTTVTLETAYIKQKQHGGPCGIPNDLVLCVIHHKAFDKGSIGLDENTRVLVSDAVDGGGVVERLFWDFDGKTIMLSQACKNCPPEGFIEWHRKEVPKG